MDKISRLSDFLNRNGTAYYGMMIGMLLVSRSGLEEEDAVEVLHYYGFHLSSRFLM